MLVKLMKYDIRSTWRNFCAVYLSILLGVIILPYIFNNIDNEIVNISAGFIAMGIVIATIVVMVGNLFKIFNTNVFSKEGYLTMTLPVSSRQIVTSKLLVSSLWIILTGIISMIAMFIYVTTMIPNAFDEIAAAMQKIMPYFNGQATFTIVLLILGMIFSAVKEIAKLFVACSIAHLKQLNRFRVPVGIISYFVFSWLETMIVRAASFGFGLIPYFESIASKLDAISDPNQIPLYISYFNGLILLGIVYSLLLIVVYSIGTIWTLNHKLDLD